MAKELKKFQQMQGLIKYLMRHWHSTPFEMCEIKYHVNFQFLLHDNGLDIEQLM
jgi:thymidylate synthase (FAD)